MSRSSPGSDRSRPKAMLFCPECGYQSHYDGDWTVTETPRRRHYACPDCEATVTVQPRLRSGERSAGAPDATASRFGSVRLRPVTNDTPLSD